MTESDLTAVLAVEELSFSSPWTRNHFLSELRSPLSFPLVAVSAQNVVLGYVCPMQVLDEGEILNIAVSPDYRGHGVGRYLIDTVITEFRARRASFVVLEVRPSNTAALSLYARRGFVAMGRRKAYYQDGEDAIQMVYEIKGNGEQSHAL